MMVIPVMITVTPRELETIGTLTIWNSGDERVGTGLPTEPNWLEAPILNRYEATWSDEFGTLSVDVWHNPDDRAMTLIAKAVKKLKKGPKV